MIANARMSLTALAISAVSRSCRAKRGPRVADCILCPTARVNKADLVVEGSVLVEVKAVDMLAPIHDQQLNTYLRLGDYRVGLLLNFAAPTMNEGIRRIVNRFPEK
jgi:hypothetical protein